MTNKYQLIGLLTAIALLATGCADVTDIERCTTSSPYGFLFGWWHGITVPFAFIGSLFSDDIAIYAVNNTGGWYDFGFCIGAGILFGGGTKAASK